MPGLIDADKYPCQTCNVSHCYQNCEKFVAWFNKTVDAVPVVRCKDCQHLNVLNRKNMYAHCPRTNTVFHPFDIDTREHFCSYGERKDNG